MITEDQSDVLSFLSDARTYGPGVAGVDRLETHSAVVFLAGTRAYKLKRAVRYDYLDFSTRERRRASCEAEVTLNRRTAPDLYLGVLPVTREPDGRLALGGPGPAVDWLVQMVRFDQDALFDKLAARGALDPGLMTGLATAIARLHETAERRPDRGGRAGMSWVIEGNALGFAEEGSGILDAAGCIRVNEGSRRELERHTPRLEARRLGGRVRLCHGDLHLRNIVLIGGSPVLFDGVEFNDDIACGDVLYDFAFLVMDLWRLQLARHANELFNAYLSTTGDLDGLELFPLFLSCRSAVRAKTSATASRLQSDAGRAAELGRAARRYLADAESLLRPPPPRLIAVGGFSGSGKSTLARSLAPSVGGAPGALVLRSDVVRKQIAGVPERTRLSPEAYAATMSDRVYTELAARAATALRAGHAVIVDAVFAEGERRNAVARVASDAGVPFAGVWLTAPEAVLARRVRDRRPDASDATVDVLHAQIESPGARPVEWISLDAAGSPDDVLDTAARTLGIGPPRGPVDDSMEAPSKRLGG